MFTLKREDGAGNTLLVRGHTALIAFEPVAHPSPPTLLPIKSEPSPSPPRPRKRSRQSVTSGLAAALEPAAAFSHGDKARQTPSPLLIGALD